MLYDFVYGVFMISLLYISVDLLSKYNKGEISNNEQLSMFFMEKGFKALKIYNKTRAKTLDIVKKCKKRKIEDDIRDMIDTKNNDTYKITFVGEDGYYFKGLLDFSEKDIYLENNGTLEENKDFTDIFIYNKDKKCYIQIDKDDLSIVTDENVKRLKEKVDNTPSFSKLFINSQVIFSIDGEEKEYDITDELSKYFCAGNKVLNKRFLKYFMVEHYETLIPDEYNISIMDKNIVMLDLTNKDNIEIIKKNEEITYKKI